MRCLAKDADDRPSSTAELLDALHHLDVADAWGEGEAKKWWALHDELAGFSTSGGSTADQSQASRTIVIDMHERAQGK